MTEENKVLLVTKDGVNWQLPGGHPEIDETPDKAFVREVAKESCAEVQQIRYLGAQEVHDPADPDGRALYYQVRFLARVRIKEFNPEFEIIERKCFDLTGLKSELGWQANNVIDEIIRRCNVNEL